MTSGRWRTGCICIAILGAIISLAFGGIMEIIIPGSVILAAITVLGKRENTALYILAAGQLLVYGAACGSYIAAVVCEVSLFAAVAGNTRMKLLIATTISLAILAAAAQQMHHTGWWTAGLVILCAILVISGYAREEAISRAMRSNSDE
ncbi:hypothetical protein [Methanogenium sp. MK-MG]|uniref:hypothetical protein n=1 Tax=Methanogenium sp. MK-MG TaxID=2599926 RepID=UPI0013EE028E|nr:hypothetical protein [Methanogenium sp. MK-MG]KAF1078608.1 hypothetical protein MKMG_00462 [Methanogenium sp. MK-MG]